MNAELVDEQNIEDDESGTETEDLAAYLREVGEHQRTPRYKKAEHIIGLLRPYFTGREIRRTLAIGSGFCFLDEKIKSDLVPDSEFISTDIDETRLRSFDHPSLTKIPISAVDVSYPDESFDFILAHQVLEHINAYPQVLDKISRMCKKGGLIYINVPNPVSPALGKLPDGTWPKPFLRAFIDHNTRKFKSDFLTDTETHHTGFTRRKLRVHLKDYHIIDLRKQRIRQEVRGRMADLLIRIFPSFLLPLIVESNIWVCMRNEDPKS